jgi:hypothetical protein
LYAERQDCQKKLYQGAYSKGSTFSTFFVASKADELKGWVKRALK